MQIILVCVLHLTVGVEPTAVLGGSARGYHTIFVPSAALGSPGYNGPPAVYLYIAALEVDFLNCRIPRVRVGQSG